MANLFLWRVYRLIQSTPNPREVDNLKFVYSLSLDGKMEKRQEGMLSGRYPKATSKSLLNNSKRGKSCSFRT